MKTSQGFVLFPVMIFMQVISFIGLYNLNSVISSMKLNGQQWEETQLRYSILAIMKIIETNALLHLPPCIIPSMSTAKITKQPSIWWQSVACSGNLQKIRYYYVAEILGKNLCVILNKQDSQVKTVDFYRITLTATSQNFGYSKIILQNTFTKMSNDIPQCTAEPDFVSLGHRMQWFI